MANGAGHEHQILSNIEMPVEFNATCSDSSNSDDTCTRNRCQRRRKKKQKQHDEESDGITAAMPADIVEDVLKRMNPKEAVRLSFVCRDWRFPAQACDPTRRPAPWRILMSQSEYHLHFLLQSVANDSVIVKVRDIRVSPLLLVFFGSWHGWLVLHRETRRPKLFLVNPFSRARFFLPPNNDVDEVLCLTSNPGAPGWAVIARDSKSSFVIWRPENRCWTVEAVEGGLRPYCSAVWFKEQLLVLDWDRSSMRLLSLEIKPSRCKDLQVKLCSDLLPPSEEVPFLRETWKYLVESEGGVLAFDVRKYARDYAEEGRLMFKAFRLDWDSMAIVRLESLGADRAIFLGGVGQAFSVSAGEAGCAGGCIYFADDCDYFGPRRWPSVSWYCCSFNDHAVTSVDRCMHTPKLFEKSGGPFWITPSVKGLSNN